MFCYQESRLPAKAAEAAQRIGAFSSRHSAENVEAQKNQVEEWYRTTFRTQKELDALQELSRLLRGSSFRRRSGE
jgi:hypothetical protein